MTRILLALGVVLSLAACSHPRAVDDRRSPSPLDAPYKRSSSDTAVSVPVADEADNANEDMPQGEELYRMFPILPAAAAFHGKPVAPNFQTASEHARKYRKELLAEAAKGPNFAGNVTLAQVDCGSHCREIFVLSPKTGKILPNTLAANEGAEFRRDSTLLMIYLRGGKKRMLEWDGKGGFRPVDDPARVEAPNGIENEGTTFVDDAGK